jgi:hypothetical protein
MRRISILGLMGLISVLAVGIAALRRPSALWATSLYSLALAAFTLAVLSAIYRRGVARASSAGFATCGWAYMALAFAPGSAEIGEVQLVATEFREPRLVTTALLHILYPHLGPADPARAGGMGPGGIMGGRMPDPPPSPWQMWSGVPLDHGQVRIGDSTAYFLPLYQRCGHALMALLVAALGGLFARLAYAAGRRDG